MDFASGTPPPGGDKNRGSIILALDGIIFGTSWTMVLLRLGTRTWITRNLGWDDATIFLAAVTNSVGLGFYISMVLYGLGRHKYYLSDYDYKMLLKWDYLDWPQTFLTLAISKISICLLLLRLSQLSKLKKVLHWLVLSMPTCGEGVEYRHRWDMLFEEYNWEHSDRSRMEVFCIYPTDLFEMRIDNIG
ncbi:hypothetical protein XANCAGTX0491_005746 [Xanthoria calcicola]